MPTKVNTAPPFQREFRRLRRKYFGVVAELAQLTDTLRRDERPGDKIPNVGYDVYKVRLANPSAGRGKSGGFRVVYYLRREDDVLLLTIYTKTQRADISPEQIRRIIEEFGS
jgi:mRNA-degrading endonuclease RelE of RelBE toxin-antitoxin system